MAASECRARRAEPCSDDRAGGTVSVEPPRTKSRIVEGADQRKGGGCGNPQSTRTGMSSAEATSQAFQHATDGLAGRLPKLPVFDQGSRLAAMPVVAAFVREQQSGDGGKHDCSVTDGAVRRGGPRRVATRPRRINCRVGTLAVATGTDCHNMSKQPESRVGGSLAGAEWVDFDLDREVGEAALTWSSGSGSRLRVCLRRSAAGKSRLRTGA